MKAWLIGAANAAISGVAVGVGGFVAGTTFKQGAVMIGISMAVSMIKWMVQHPIPGGTN